MSEALPDELQQSMDEGRSRDEGTPRRFQSLFHAPADTDDRRVQLVLMLLSEHPERQWELSEIAQMVNLSPGRLAHLFKDEIGLTIQQFITQLRLAKARRQLESSFLSIKEIAAAVGFRNVTRFTNSFKTAVGVTPAEYRRRPMVAPVGRKNASLARSANR